MRGYASGLVLVATIVAPAACGGSDSGNGGGGQGLGTAGCLTDQQICQFQVGVSTENDVKNALGNAQEYLGSSAAVYVCQQVSGTEIVHNDQVIFDFDSSGRFHDVTVLRQGTGSTPPPNCSSGPGSSGGSSGSSGGTSSSCASVRRPQPNTTTCQTSVFQPNTPSITTCTDPSGSSWSSSCNNGSCGCSYNDSPACSCTQPDAGISCCPGLQ